MKTLELEDQTAEALLAQAAMRGLSLSTYLQQMVSATQPLRAPQALTVDDLDSLIDMSAGTFPTLPTPLSRADIYSDHD